MLCERIALVEFFARGTEMWRHGYEIIDRAVYPQIFMSEEVGFFRVWLTTDGAISLSLTSS